MSKYVVYPSYKDSGVEWLGEIPEGWNISKLRFIFSFGKGLTITKANLVDKGVPCVSYGEIHSKYGFEVSDEKHKLKCVDESYLSASRTSLLSKGDFVFADTSEDIEGAGNFTHVSGDTPIFAGYHTIIARQTDAHSFRFLAYLIDSEAFRTQIRLSVKGVKVLSITQFILRSSIVWLPPLQEQQTISNYLDKAIAKIDTLIEKQTKLIELLKEKRQAVISTAVTRGLDSSVPMKESGVEWLGEIPEHWEVKQGKYIGEILSTPSVGDDDLDETSPVLYIKVDDLNYIESAYLLTSKHRVNSNSMRTITEFICFPKRGAAIFTNKVCIVNVKSMIDPNLMAWKIFKKYNKEYILMLLLVRGLSEIADISTVPQINNKHIEPLKFPIPSIDEQEKIVKFVDNKTSKIDNLITKATKAIELLKERRTALISAVVTGKIDVRDAV